MRHNAVQPDLEDLLRSSMGQSARHIPVPDVWTAIKGRIAQEGRREPRNIPGVSLRRLAPAGTMFFLLFAVAALVILMNNRATDTSTPGVGSNPGKDTGDNAPATTDAEVFISALRSLETAAPFRVESQSTVPSNTVGGEIGLTWPAYSADSLFWRTFPDIATEGGVPHGFYNGEDFEDRNCRTFETARLCDRVWIPSGEALGYSVSYWGTHVGAGIFVSSDLYRTRRQLVLDPDLKQELNERSASSHVRSIETIYDFRQEDGMFYAVDGINRSISPFAEVAEGEPATGSLYSFLMSHLSDVHLYRFLRFSGTDIVDAANFSDIERVTPEGERDGDGLVHYRAGISSFLGDAGIWDMWVSPGDGLPRRVSIEAFTPPGSADEQLLIARATLNFSDFGKEMSIYGDLLLLDAP